MQLFELSKSIGDKGVLVPLLVRTNPIEARYEIIAGHKRKAASEWAGIDTVPVFCVYNEFLKEYGYRKKYFGVKENIQ